MLHLSDKQKHAIAQQMPCWRAVKSPKRVRIWISFFLNINLGISVMWKLCMVSRIEVTTAVNSTRRSFQFKVRPIGQALATESDTKPNFRRFSVSWDLADKLSRPILAAATSTLHSTTDGEFRTQYVDSCRAFH